MNLIVNGETMNVDGELTVKTLLEAKGYDPTGVAVAVNQEFVSKAHYETTTLKVDDDVEVVAPMQGG